MNRSLPSLLLPVLLAFGLSACVTSRNAPPPAMPSPAPEPVIASTPAAQAGDAIAQHLAHLARHDPARLDAVMPEMQALASALAFGPEGRPASDTSAEADLPPAPDMSGARSLRHGVHLASYRLEDNAQAGWAELVEAHSELSGMEARIERRDLGERGIFLRLKAGPFDSHGAAQAFCASLGGDAVYCMPVDFTGETLAPMSIGGGE